ncbi:Bax inhibitor-1/YccA family protein [Streptomyces sp. BI20]|uniref:Bax inhibitor-1/YccA family protein n=1 Tax=Streptomyces sp. BI20 TaxID=3403460 RepID=UPI003C770276
MRSSNPVFSRRGFSRDNSGYAGFDAQHQQAGAAATNPYATNPYATDPQTGMPQAPVNSATAMTIDDVVARTATTLGLVVATAIPAYLFLSKNFAVAIGAAVIAFVLAMVQSFKSKPMPGVILGYAAFEGVFLGAISGAVGNAFGFGAIMQAVLGTAAVFGGVLFAYKMRWIRVNRRFIGFVMAAAVGFLLLSLVNMVAALIGGGDGLGLRGNGPMGILFGVAGVIIGAFFLALDFKQVEDGITYGAPKAEAWLAAFGLTLTLVWIYTEMLRLVAIFSGDD